MTAPRHAVDRLSMLSEVAVSLAAARPDLVPPALVLASSSDGGVHAPRCRTPGLALREVPLREALPFALPPLRPPSDVCACSGLLDTSSGWVVFRLAQVAAPPAVDGDDVPADLFRRRLHERVSQVFAASLTAGVTAEALEFAASVGVRRLRRAAPSVSEARALLEGMSSRSDALEASRPRPRHVRRTLRFPGEVLVAGPVASSCVDLLSGPPLWTLLLLSGAEAAPGVVRTSACAASALFASLPASDPDGSWAPASRWSSAEVSVARRLASVPGRFAAMLPAARALLRA